MNRKTIIVIVIICHLSSFVPFSGGLLFALLLFETAGRPRVVVEHLGM
jgi:hypothetical protein